MWAKSPRAGSSAGHIGLQLDGQAEESIEAVEGNVGDVADVPGPPNLHLADPPPVALAGDPRLPQDGEEKREERELIPAAATATTATALLPPPAVLHRVGIAVCDGAGVRRRSRAGKGRGP